MYIDKGIRAVKHWWRGQPKKAVKVINKMEVKRDFHKEMLLKKAGEQKDYCLS